MINKHKLIFVSSFVENLIPSGGQIVKARKMSAALEKKFNLVKIDTFFKYYWPVVIFKIIFQIKVLKHSAIVFLSSKSTSILFRFLNHLSCLDKIGYFVVGGWFPIFLSSNLHLIPIYKKLKFISVEGYLMKQQLQNLGLENVIVHRNFKDNMFIIDEFNNTSKKEITEQIKLIFISRVCREKGIDVVIEAIKKINSKGKINIKIDIYGPIDLEYENEFKSSIISPYIFYGGILDLDSQDVIKSIYQENYDFFIFPTRYIGEGVPGALIDSIKIGIPIIASDWNLNAEIVKEGFNGYLFNINNIKSLEMIFDNYVRNKTIRSILVENQLSIRKEFSDKFVVPEIISKINNSFFS